MNFIKRNPQQKISQVRVTPRWAFAQDQWYKTIEIFLENCEQVNPSSERILKIYAFKRSQKILLELFWFHEKLICHLENRTLSLSVYPFFPPLIFKINSLFYQSIELSYIQLANLFTLKLATCLKASVSLFHWIDNKLIPRPLPIVMRSIWMC